MALRLVYLMFSRLMQWAVLLARDSAAKDIERRCCVGGPADVFEPGLAGDQIAWASSVNAAASRVVGGTSMPSS